MNVNARKRRAFADRVVACFLCLLAADFTLAQEPISPGSRYYNRDGVYVPYDAGYKTYIYKDRRYGYQPSYLDPIYRGPTRAPEDRYLYDVSEKSFKTIASMIFDIITLEKQNYLHVYIYIYVYK